MSSIHLHKYISFYDLDKYISFLLIIIIPVWYIPFVQISLFAPSIFFYLTGTAVWLAYASSEPQDFSKSEQGL
jgi:hypothetical protein